MTVDILDLWKAALDGGHPGGRLPSAFAGVVALKQVAGSLIMILIPNSAE